MRWHRDTVRRRWAARSKRAGPAARRNIKALDLRLARENPEWGYRRNVGDQAGRVKFMIRDRGPDFTRGFDAVLADAGIRTVPCNVRTPRLNTIAERWKGMSPRAPGPHPHLEPAPFAADLAAEPKWAERCPRNRSEIPAK